MRTLLLCLASALLLAASLTFETRLPERDDPPAGVVTDGEGRPLPGIFVTAQDTARGVSVTVVTDAEGRYRIPAMPGMSFRLRARQVGFETETRDLYDPSSRPSVDFVLRRRDDVYDQLPSSSFLSMLPDGAEKRAFVLDCAGCHQFDQRIVSFEGRPKSHDLWVARIRQMLSFAGADTGFPIMSPSRDAEKTAAWLVEHLGTPDAPRRQPAPPPPPPAAGTRVVITEYDVPVRQDLPHDLMLDAEGHVVITGMMTAQMYRLDPATGVFATVPIPVQHAGPRALDLDPEGNWWVLLGNPRQIARYDPKANDWKTYPIGMYPHDVLRGRDGRVWFNGHFTKNPELIGYLDPTTGAVKTYEVPSPAMPDGGSTIPYGMRFDAAGTLWATQLVGNRLIKFVPETERFTLYDLPTPHSGPRRPAVGPDGAIWIPEFAANKLARFDPARETFEEFPLPIPDALPYIVRVDPRTNVVWIATGAADAVLRFDPATERFTVHRLPTQKALIRHMELDPRTGAAWVAYGNSPATDPKIARIEVTGQDGTN